MIQKVAVKLNDVVYAGEKGERHDSVIGFMLDKGLSLSSCIMGFLDDQGNFLNRHQAAIHAFKCGQLKDTTCPNIILSEDLW